MAGNRFKRHKKQGKVNEELVGDAFQEESTPETLQQFYSPSKRLRILGLCIIFLAIILGLAIISFFFSWREDFDKIQMGGFAFLFSNDIAVSNIMGRIGLWLAYYVAYIGFGWASIIVSWLLFLWGASLFFKNFKKLTLRRLSFYLSCMLYISVCLSFVLSSFDFLYGGYAGQMLAEWLANFIGIAGLTFLLVTIAMAYILWSTGIALNYTTIKSFFMKWTYARSSENVETTEAKPEDKTDTPEDDTPITEEVSQVLYEQVEKEEEAPKGNVIASGYEFEVVDTTKTTKLEEGKADGHLLDMIEVKEKLRALDAEITNDTTETQPITDSQTLNEQVDDKSVDTPTKTASKPADGEIEFDIAPLVKSTEEDIHNDDEAIIEQEVYKLPPTSILSKYEQNEESFDKQELEANKQQIIQTLSNFKINIRKISATIGPTVTLYEIIPEDGTRISKIKNLEDDIALSLSALGIRIIAPIPGKGTIGIEVPNKTKKMVGLRSLIRSTAFQKNTQEHILPIAFGKAIDNTDFIIDLAKMPHILMAGATGQGKSVGLNALLVSLLYKNHPDDLKLVLVDPKKVELSLFRKLENHFLAKLPGEEESIITDTKKVINMLNALCVEMDNRYDLLKEAMCKNIVEYNKKVRERKLLASVHKHLPYIVIVIDEFADLIMTAGKEVELPIARIAQLARAVGLHLVIATQRPSVNIITGMIKANFPVRVAFKVSSKVDSRTILDEGGADQLIGRGDMLISSGGHLTRLQCAFVDTQEVENICDFIATQIAPSEPYYLPEISSDEQELTSSKLEERDPLFEDAAQLVVSTQSGSTSLIQRKMKLGFNRAARLMDQLEAVGIVSGAKGAKPRDVLVHSELDLAHLLENLNN